MRALSQQTPLLIRSKVLSEASVFQALPVTARISDQSMLVTDMSVARATVFRPFTSRLSVSTPC